MGCERRGFLQGVGASLLGASAVHAHGLSAFALRASADGAATAAPAPAEAFPAKQARHWTALPDKKIRCDLCPRKCEVADRERGYCGVRENRDGAYVTLVWGRACSLNVDPIEKKPLFHFLPGTTALSTATAGCNMECKFCQNWEISQFRPEQVEARAIMPAQMADLAVARGIGTIAYTYSEPVVFFEYMYDCAAAGNAKKIRSVMISNGYIQEPALKELCDVLAAVKVDLKGFTEKFYKEYTKGELAPVLATLKFLAKRGMWLEIVDLLIPSLNDGAAELTEMCKWIAGELGAAVPVHFTRYHPMYKLKNLPPTPLQSLERAYDIAKKSGLAYVYLGNVSGHKAESTYCPACGKTVIQRYGYRVDAAGLAGGKCAGCGAAIPGVWK